MADPAYIVDGVLTDGEAWVGIAHASLSLPAALVTFTSTDDGQTGDFSQYLDMVLVCYTRSDAGSAIRYLHMNFNNSSGPRHLVQWFWGDGATDYASATSISTSAQAIGVVLGGGAVANGFSCTVTHLMDINSGKIKSGLTKSSGEADSVGEVLTNAVTWIGTDPITEIDLTTYTDDFVAGSAFSLFGILPRMVA
jgi:hypothetical protein